MKILLVSTSFNGMTQRFYSELSDTEYEVAVELHLGDEDRLREGVHLYDPELIICPFLTKRIPEDIWRKYLCIIVHPGIMGDRGPSSLDWAIQNGAKEWGVTLLEAAEEMDAGHIWVSKNFPMRKNASKGSMYNREITKTAVECLWELLACIKSSGFRPEPLDYGNPDVKGGLNPLMKQADRVIDWESMTTDEVVTRINAADGSPGVADKILEQDVFMYNASPDKVLKGPPGQVIATANKAICRATKDGSVWIGHLKRKAVNGQKGIKLFASNILQDVIDTRLLHLKIDYTKEGRHLPVQEIWYEVVNDVAYIHMEFHNGAMATEQCQDLLRLYKYVMGLPVKAIVLMGGEDFWSNGIHLNQIEAAENPALESWRNINAIDDIVYQIITTMDKVTISAVAGNAGAGGAIMALATDITLSRKGVVFNPHYKNMGGLYGSEYWTYLLPKKVGYDLAMEISEQCLPMSATQAWKQGLIDKILDDNHHLFYAQVRNIASGQVSDPEIFERFLRQKVEERRRDEAQKGLALYRRDELAQMHQIFFGEDKSYHVARTNFVFKSGQATAPEVIQFHRTGVKESANKNTAPRGVPAVPASPNQKSSPAMKSLIVDQGETREMAGSRQKHNLVQKY